MKKIFTLLFLLLILNFSFAINISDENFIEEDIFDKDFKFHLKEEDLITRKDFFDLISQSLVKDYDIEYFKENNIIKDDYNLNEVLDTENMSRICLNILGYNNEDDFYSNSIEQAFNLGIIKTFINEKITLKKAKETLKATFSTKLKNKRFDILRKNNLINQKNDLPAIKTITSLDNKTIWIEFYKCEDEIIFKNLFNVYLDDNQNAKCKINDLKNAENGILLEFDNFEYGNIKIIYNHFLVCEFSHIIEENHKIIKNLKIYNVKNLPRIQFVRKY